MMALWAQHFTDLPVDLLDKANDVQVYELTLTLTFEERTIAINYMEANPSIQPLLNVLFLHGASFSSRTWKEIGTLQIVAAMGYRVVAVDMPGFGKTPSLSINDTGKYVVEIARALNLLKPVLICPSMSGRYGLPAILKPSMGTREDNFSGFIPIAPVCTESFTAKDYKQCQIPTMIVYGERDVHAQIATLSQMPNSEVFMMRNAGHACYMNDVPEWHRLLYNFLLRIRS